MSSDRKKAELDAQGLISDFASQKCPYCGKRLKVVSRVVGGWTRYAVCHHCGQDARTHPSLATWNAAVLRGTPSAPEPTEQACPSCGKYVRASAYSCSGCGAVLP